MSLIGNIVKTAVEINQKLTLGPADPDVEQLTQLKNLLEEAKNTSFGQYHGFQNILDAEDPIAAFQKQIPLHEYTDMAFWWERQQLYPNITWPGKPRFFALTSGTTGSKPKRIPVTDEAIESMRSVASDVATELPNFDLPPEVFESKVFMLSSSVDLKQHENGHLEGEISGINVNNFPSYYDFFYAPGVEIASIDDWDERVQKIVEKAPEWDIGAIAGIPSWVLVALKAIIKAYDLQYIQDIWPNLKVYASGGVAFETYRKEFEKISNCELIIIDTYLASEGFFGHTINPDTLSMRLAISNGYFFEFIPFDERGVNEFGDIKEDAEVLTIKDVQMNEEYVLVISTTAGAWRYILGDTIKFTALDPPQIKLTGRTKFFLNITGSQLSEEKMDDAIKELADHLDVTVNEYMVSAMPDESDEYIHQWILVTDDTIDENKTAKSLDDILKKKNKNYGVARNKTLKDVKVKRISKKQYGSYMDEKKKKGGQMKIPKVMDAEEMKSILDNYT